MSPSYLLFNGDRQLPDYNLRAVIYKTGTQDAGHYLSEIHDAGGPHPSRYIVNDSTVTKNGDIPPGAHVVMVFYQKPHSTGARPGSVITGLTGRYVVRC